MFNIFGSKNSQDYDIMWYVNEIPQTQEAKLLCAKMESDLGERYPGKKRNVNLAVVEDGVITKVFKGSPDECNNSVFNTYALHEREQMHFLPVKRTVPRDVPLKLARGLRIILSFLSRTEHREKVKAALRGSTKLKIETLESIDFSKITDLGKNNQDVTEFYKVAAFQIGQCHALLDKKELYTKQDVLERYPSLEPYLARKQWVGGTLDAHKRWLLDLIRAKFPDLELIHESL